MKAQLDKCDKSIVFLNGKIQKLESDLKTSQDQIGNRLAALENRVAIIEGKIQKHWG
jgi:hypothetical protein